MAYILSKLPNAQCYTQYVKGINNINLPNAQIVINGGADITNKNLVTPQGVVTQITDNELEILKVNLDFQKHLEKGFIKYYKIRPDEEKEASKMERDASAPLTPEYYEKQGKKAPKTAPKAE